jgi:hypothetical protein
LASQQPSQSSLLRVAGFEAVVAVAAARRQVK